MKRTFLLSSSFSRANLDSKKGALGYRGPGKESVLAQIPQGQGMTPEGEEGHNKGFS
jgi:hypothetical protein